MYVNHEEPKNCKNVNVHHCKYEGNIVTLKKAELAIIFLTIRHFFLTSQNKVVQTYLKNSRCQNTEYFLPLSFLSRVAS